VHTRLSGLRRPSISRLRRPSISRLRRPRLDPVVVDRWLAALLTVGGEIDAWLAQESVHHRLAYALVTPVLTASIAVRRRYPALIGTAVPLLAALSFALWQGPPFIGNPLANFCAMYALAVWTPTRSFIIGFALVVAGFTATAAGPKANLRASTSFTIVVAVVILLVRRVVGDRERRAKIAERERDVAAREAVVEERARIARELHDVIAHHVSMIVVQAGAERRVLGDANPATRDVLETVERIGRAALTETRRLLGMLRGDASDPLTPQPGLADVPALVGQLRAAGLPVELQIEGERRQLPVGIELSAYRIVQEALTNALKHAGEARATVRVRYGVASLDLEVIDDGAGARRAGSGSNAGSGTNNDRGQGHGLVGMRERVSLYGGRFDAHQNPAGGFVVRAKLPIT
jgi:signal transduction histidine kinase